LYNVAHRHERTWICDSHVVSKFFVISKTTVVIKAVLFLTTEIIKLAVYYHINHTSENLFRILCKGKTLSSCISSNTVVSFFTMSQDIWVLQWCASVWLRMNNNNNNNNNNNLLRSVVTMFGPTFPLTLGCQGGSPSPFYSYDITFISLLFCKNIYIQFCLNTCQKFYS